MTLEIEKWQRAWGVGMFILAFKALESGSLRRFRIRDTRDRSFQIAQLHLNKAVRNVRGLSPQQRTTSLKRMAAVDWYWMPPIPSPAQKAAAFAQHLQKSDLHRDHSRTHLKVKQDQAHSVLKTDLWSVLVYAETCNLTFCFTAVLNLGYGMKWHRDT